MAVSFDLFGTLVEVDSPGDPGRAIATALSNRDVSVPSDWGRVYTTPHVETQPGAELSLIEHVVAGLESRGRDVSTEIVRAAIREAFDPAVRTRPGARTAVAAAANDDSVGILSNCSVPGLVQRTLARSALNTDIFSAVVSSVDCGWRKPDKRAFRAIAERLNSPLCELTHVGDDPATDGGATEVGARAILLDDVPLSDVVTKLEQLQ